MSLILLSHAEQVASHLRGELSRGRWRHVLPGIKRLGVELGLNHNTVEAALVLLEEEGWVESQGRGLPRRVGATALSPTKRSLQVKILLYEAGDRWIPYNVELLARLQEAGYAADYAQKSLKELGMKVERVARFVEKHPAEAWVVSSASHEVLQWFSAGPVPAIAMFGRSKGLPIAAATPRKIPALVAATRKLVALGHQRIVMICREERRKPEPGLFERAFLNELAALGVPTGSYNLPDWKETPDGLEARFETLFRYTPPTALILEETTFFVALQQYLARPGVVVPRSLSLICSDPDPTFAFCKPAIAHIRWDYRPLVNRVLRWADEVAHGREDLEQTHILAEFVEGGTILPVR
jgi:DNA-binding LacI/PurR family transcriptional regulator